MTAHAKAIKLLKSEGYKLARHGANHDVYFNEQTKTMIALKRHDFNENDLKYIIKEINTAKLISKTNKKEHL